MNKEERGKEHSRDRGGEQVNDKREGKRGKKKIWVAILAWEKKWYIDEEDREMIVKMLQPKEKFPIS